MPTTLTVLDSRLVVGAVQPRGNSVCVNGPKERFGARETSPSNSARALRRACFNDCITSRAPFVC